MLNNKALQTATIAGTVLQLAMVIAGHYVPYIALHVFMFGGMAISLVAGLLYGRAAAGLAGAALGGAIAGGVCALIGIALCVALGDTAPIILVFGTIGSTVSGALGGALGRLVGGTGSASSA
ncbi:MAG TPA: hypothetical protein VNU97_06995 [Rhizomicrobium sp.]|jgi:hypothetical protein|nr:hypothetical protein [Rhizomicrobium sp.]